MPNGFTNFRSVPEVYQKPKPVVVKASDKKVDSSAASFCSDAETLKGIPQRRSLLRSIADGKIHFISWLLISSSFQLTSQQL